MQELNKNIDHLFSKAKTAKVDMSLSKVQAGLIGTSVLSAAAATTLISKTKIISIMLASGFAVTTAALLMTYSPSNGVEQNTPPMDQTNIVSVIEEEPQSQPIFFDSTELLTNHKEAEESTFVKEVPLNEEIIITENLVLDPPPIEIIQGPISAPSIAPEDSDLFHSIVINLDCDVELFKGNTCKTDVLQEELKDVVEFIIEDGVLTVGIAEGKEKEYRKVSKNRVVEVELTMTEIRAITLSGRGVIHSDDKIPSENLTVSLAGSGDIWLNEVAPKNYEINLAGSGDISIKGKSAGENGVINISGSGDVCMGDVSVENAIISIAGSADVYLTATQRLTVSINGSGDVEYNGEPETQISIRGSGDVHKNTCNK